MLVSVYLLAARNLLCVFANGMKIEESSKVKSNAMKIEESSKVKSYLHFIERQME